ncbi:Bursb (predicted) [Pycnogonum litorale]
MCFVCLEMSLGNSISWFGIDNYSNKISGIRSSCETLPSTVHVIKEDYNSDGILKRSCEGELSVTKCEGTCVSQVTPSVVTPNGFLKDCQCCREGKLRDREVILTKCYDGDGKTIHGDPMKMQVQEPIECGCHRCGD